MHQNKILKGKNLRSQCRILYPSKKSLKNEDEIEDLSDISELEELIPSRPVLQVEGKGY